MTKRILVSFALALLGMGWLPAQAARVFNAAQTSPTPAPGQFNMGTTQSVTMGVTNTNTGGNTEIYRVVAEGHVTMKRDAQTVVGRIGR